MRTLFPVSGLLSLLALGAGCEPVLFSAEIDAPEVCVGGLELPFPPSSFDVETEDTISADDLGIPDDEALELALRLRSLSITPMAGVGDLGFLDALIVTATPVDPDSELPELVLIDMDSGDLREDGSLYAEPPSPVEMAHYLRSGDLLFRVEASGERPDFMWAAELELCFDASARYEQSF